MLIDYRVNCNNYNEKILNNYSILPYSCPKCSGKHSFTRHGSYERNVSLIDESKNIVDKRMTILRVKCSSCNSTHAILPNDIIPYCIYSFSFVLNVLTEFYSSDCRVLDICLNFSISFQLIYMFVQRFLAFLSSVLLALRNLGFNLTAEPSKVLDTINSFKTFREFLYQYFFNCKWVFLMFKFKNITPRPVFIGEFFSDYLHPHNF